MESASRFGLLLSICKYRNVELGRKISVAPEMSTNVSFVPGTFLICFSLYSVPHFSNKKPDHHPLPLEKQAWNAPFIGRNSVHVRLRSERDDFLLPEKHHSLIICHAAFESRVPPDGPDSQFYMWRCSSR